MRPSLAIRRSAAFALALSMLWGTGAAAQDGSPAASDQPDGSPSPSVDGCEPFRQEPLAKGRPSARGGPVALALEGPAAEDDPYRCPLPAWDTSAAWPFAGRVNTAEAFHWALPSDEALDPQGDIVGVGWAPVRLTRSQARRLGRSGDFVMSDLADKVFKAGDYLLIQVETAAAPKIAADRNLSFHIGTDRDGDPTNNSPASAANPDSLYQDLQNVYTLFLVAGRASPSLHVTDLAGRRDAAGSPWYNDRLPFAARVTQEPAGVQFLLPASAVGASFRPIAIDDGASASAPGPLLASIGGMGVPAPAMTVQDGLDSVPVIPTGSDFGRLGTHMGMFPKDGRAIADVGCVNLSTIHQVVKFKVIEFGDSPMPGAEAPSGSPTIWCVTPTFEDGELFDAWFKQSDADGNGVTELEVKLTFVHRSERVTKTTLTQTTTVRIMRRPSGNIYPGTIVGLIGYGFYDLTDVEIASSGDAWVDRILGRSAENTATILPAWHVSEPEGRTAGSKCVGDADREALTGGPR